MAWTDHTDPGVSRTGVRQVRLTLKDYAVLLGLAAALWGAVAFVFSLMYFDRSRGETLERDVVHHVATAEPKIEKLEQAKEEFVESLHRIELRQMQTAPRHVRDRLPPVPPNPNGN